MLEGLWCDMEGGSSTRGTFIRLIASGMGYSLDPGHFPCHGYSRHSAPGNILLHHQSTTPCILPCLEPEATSAASGCTMLVIHVASGAD